VDRQLFDSRSGFEAKLALCIGRARLLLQMFDPDFSSWQLGSAVNEAALRAFFQGGGRLLLAAHSKEFLEKEAPRFLRLFGAYGPQIECRVTQKQLKSLTDSFCIADGRDIVRRFHADWYRGEACFDDPAATQTSAARFDAIWLETLPGLQAHPAGL
jgi:hypothetical protein